MLTILSFLFFVALVAVLTWYFTRSDDRSTETGFFLAGRSLTWPFIAGSLLLTNLSTEQMVGLNGDAFAAGLSVMVWEVAAVVALVVMAAYFLPRFLKSGIATIPQLLEIRFDHSTQMICNVIFLAAYATILLPIILYTGAQGLSGILDMKALTGIESSRAIIWLMVWVVGIIGSCYALFGGLSSVAFSDLLNGIGLLVGGLLITFFGLRLIGEGQGVFAGLNVLTEAIPERLNSIGGADAPVPFGEIFTGVLIINLFYWCTNQQIIQRSLAAHDLKEGQKGVLMCAFFKLLGPLYLVLPGIMAYYWFVVKGNMPDMTPVEAYGNLVRTVLPTVLTGFFCAMMVGAILSSFNSALNSTCTIFSLGIYKGVIRKDASEERVIKSGKWFGWIMAVIAMTVAPLLIGQDSIFTYLQTMNGIYNIPIFAVVLVGLLGKRVPPAAAKFGLVGGVVFIALSYFVFPSFGFDLREICGGNYHFLGIAFATLLAIMLIWGRIAPRQEAWVQEYTHDVDLTPWKWTVPACIVLIVLVISIYGRFADFSVLNG